jgi:hypothetical protein
MAGLRQPSPVLARGDDDDGPADSPLASSCDALALKPVLYLRDCTVEVADHIPDSDDRDLVPFRSLEDRLGPGGILGRSKRPG